MPYEKGKFVSDRRRVKLEEIMREGYISLYSGRPKRDDTINSDDISNLKIALETTNDINVFVQQV